MLIFDNDVNEPLIVPLGEPTLDDPYPILVQIDSSGEVEYEGGCSNASGTVNVLDAEWDIDAGG